MSERGTPEPRLFPAGGPGERMRGPGAGGGTVRVGDTVRRAPDRAPEGMRLVLAYLEERGFDAAPRLLGRDELGRWVLSYVPGEAAIPPYPEWASRDEALAGVAELLRRYHDAVAGFRAPPGTEWRTRVPPGYTGTIIGHMDVSMANVVFRDGRAAALIDFEEAAPVDPLWDVVRTARHWVPLLDPVDLEAGLERLDGRQGERLALFCDAYGLDRRARSRLADATLLSADVTYEHMREGAARGHPGYLREWTGHAARRNRRGRAWVEAHRGELERALGV